MSRLLVARAPTHWRSLPLAALAVIAQLALGLLVMGLRVARVVITVIATAATSAEHALAARTGRPALSQTSIAALAIAFATEFRAAYHQPTR